MVTACFVRAVCTVNVRKKGRATRRVDGGRQGTLRVVVWRSGAPTVACSAVVASLSVAAGRASMGRSDHVGAHHRATWPFRRG